MRPTRTSAGGWKCVQSSPLIASRWRSGPVRLNYGGSKSSRSSHSWRTERNIQAFRGQWATKRLKRKTDWERHGGFPAPIRSRFADPGCWAPISFHNHLFLERLKRLVSAPWNQALTRANSGRFLERLWRARQAVPTPIPSSRETTRHEAPAAEGLSEIPRCSSIWSEDTPHTSQNTDILVDFYGHSGTCN